MRKEQDAQRLPHHAEDAPEDDVAEEGVFEPLVDPFGDVRKRRLAYHAEERVKRELAERHTKDEFVRHGGEGEDEEGGHELGGAGAEGWVVCAQRCVWEVE